MFGEQKVKLPVFGQKDRREPEVPISIRATPYHPEDVRPIDRASLALEQRAALRTSSYTIYVNLPDSADDMLLVHGYTGAYDKVSKAVGAYLRSLDTAKHKPLHGTWSAERSVEGAVFKPADETIAKLKKRGYLTAMTVDEEESFFTKLAVGIHHRAVRSAPRYILVPTYQCNLRCPYCFQDYMRTNPGYQHLLRVIDREMVDRLFLGMRRIEAAHSLPADGTVQRSITFFGGEPLLAESRPIIEYIMRKAQSEGRVRFNAISNATELSSYRDLLGPDGIASIQITLDGPQLEHDRRRIYPDGSGSFHRIAENIAMALSQGTRISVRMNVDRRNIGQLPVLAEELERLGLSSHRGFSAYVAPIHSHNEKSEEVHIMNSWQLNQALAELRERHPSLRRIGGTDDSLMSRVRSIFDERSDPMPSFQADFCGAHNSMYILDSFGDIYACWEKLGDPSIRIGHVDASGDVFMNKAITDTWRSRSVASNPVCRKCRYATYCGGGCAVLAEGQNGELHSNHCDGFAQRFRASAARAYIDHIEGNEVLVNAERICDL